MKPDIRPVKGFTEALLESSPWWVFITSINGCIHPTHNLHVLDDGSVRSTSLFWSERSRCYPCKFDLESGIITPLPWPIAEGEEEIIEWRGLSYSCDVYQVAWNQSWRINSARCPAPQAQKKDGHRPSPRQGNHWVWEEYK